MNWRKTAVKSLDTRLDQFIEGLKMIDTVAAPCTHTPRAFRALLKVPFLGWQLEGFCRKETGGKILALANILMIWLLAILFFGYPAFIIPVYAMVPVISVLILLMTRMRT